MGSLDSTHFCEFGDISFAIFGRVVIFNDFYKIKQFPVRFLIISDRFDWTLYNDVIMTSGKTTEKVAPMEKLST